MFDSFNSISPSIMTWASGIIIVLIGVYFSRKKTAAEATDKITLSYGRLFDEYDKRMKRVETDLAKEQFKNGKLSSRISSLEHNDTANQAWIKSLETSHEILQKKMRDWSHGIEILIAQIERHDSRPDWTPAKDD